jgi:hypothetical protein
MNEQIRPLLDHLDEALVTFEEEEEHFDMFLLGLGG